MLTGNSNFVDEFYTLTNKLLVLKTNPTVTEEQIETFQALLSSPKWNGQSALKVMAAQFIPQYIRFFPDAHEAAINAQLDFCEDQDVKVRKESIKNLVIFAKNIPDYAGRVADVLLQLLQTSDPEELKVVKSALLNNFQLFPKDSLDALFHQIEHGVQLVRVRACDFLQNLLLPVSAAGLKQKILSRFLPLLGKTTFSEIELEMIFMLLPDSKLSGIPIYNAQLEILYKKRLEALVANPAKVTAKKILEISKFYKHLFITGTSSFSLISFLAIHVLDPKQSLLKTVVEELQILKLICDLLAYAPELGSLADLVPYFLNVFQALVPSLTMESTIKLVNMKLEPILYFFVYYRIKSPAPTKSNNSILDSCLRKSYTVAQHMKQLTMKELLLIPENDPKREPREKILVSTSMMLTYATELLKGPSMSTKIDLTNSWNVKAVDYLKAKFPSLFKSEQVANSTEAAAKKGKDKKDNLKQKDTTKINNGKSKIVKNFEKAKHRKISEKAMIDAVHNPIVKPVPITAPKKLEPILLRAQNVVIEKNSQMTEPSKSENTLPTVKFVPSKSELKRMISSPAPDKVGKKINGSLSQKLGIGSKKIKNPVSEIVLVKKDTKKVKKKSKKPRPGARSVIVRQ